MMTITKTQIEDYKDLDVRFRNAIIKLGEFYMETFEMHKDSRYVEVRNGCNGFNIRYRSDDEYDVEMPFSVDELADLEKIKQMIHKKKISQETELLRHSAYLAQQKIEQEKKEYQRLKAKFEQNTEAK